MRRTRTPRRLKCEPLESRALLAVLSGSVYFDADGDDTRDASEQGTPGIVIRLAEMTAPDTVLQSVITDNGGNYSFEDLAAGTYQVSKRPTSATGDDDDASSVLDITLEADQVSGGNDFSELPLRPQAISISWFFASAPPTHQLIREAIANVEESAGDPELADSIRTEGEEAPPNSTPVASDDEFETVANVELSVDAAGVLENDQDADGDVLTAQLVDQAENGLVSLDTDGSFTYTPNQDFFGTDSFTYQASDADTTSNLATVTITVDDGVNEIPQVNDDTFTVQANEVFTVEADQGVLVNDSDGDGDELIAALITEPSNGTVLLETDGSLSYTPDVDFFGEDSFTYTATDSESISDIATVVFNVTVENRLFGPVTPGSFEDEDLLGIRTDLVPGAPAITRTHVDGDVDYSRHSNPPTYGDHHPFDPRGDDVNPGLTPRATGVYTEEQPEEDLIHNLEHGHVWISYDPELIGPADLAALEQFVRDGSTNDNGGGVGVILTPRAANDDMIAVASWARLQTFDRYDPIAIRNFIETNRGHAPEGFITP